MTTRTRFLFAASIALASAACGDPSDPGGDDDDPGVDAAAGDHPDAAANVDYAAMCQRMAGDVAACAVVPQAACVTAFERGAQRGCTGWLDDLEAWILDHDPAYQCVALPGLGDVPTIGDAAPEDAVIGDACAGAVNRTDCYGIACDGSLDCPSGWGCNDATGHCFDQEATCAGIPCDGSLDCPSGETCNTAQGVCIRN